MSTGSILGKGIPASPEPGHAWQLEACGCDDSGPRDANGHVILLGELWRYCVCAERDVPLMLTRFHSGATVTAEMGLAGLEMLWSLLVRVANWTQ